MLNELREYQQYTFNIEKDTEERKFSRLNHRQLCNSLSGIERAMTIIARYFYYNYWKTEAPGDKQPTKKEKIDLVHSSLAAWCGLMNKGEVCPPKAKHIENWLPKYIEEVLKKDAEGNEQSIKRLQESLEKLKNKKTEFSKHMMIDYVSDQEATKYHNDVKKITYESIIANAINAGELTNRVLLSKQNPFDRIIKEKGKLDGSELDEGKKDRIIKIICAFLLNRTNFEQRYAVVNRADVANWCKDNPKMDKDDYNFLYKDSTKEINMPLFERRLVGNNILKIFVEPELLNWCDFKICGDVEGEIDKLREQGYIYVFRDEGSGIALLPSKLEGGITK